MNVKFEATIFRSTTIRDVIFKIEKLECSFLVPSKISMLNIRKQLPRANETSFSPVL